MHDLIFWRIRTHDWKTLFLGQTGCAGVSKSINSIYSLVYTLLPTYSSPPIYYPDAQSTPSAPTRPVLASQTCSPASAYLLTPSVLVIISAGLVGRRRATWKKQTAFS